MEDSVTENSLRERLILNMKEESPSERFIKLAKASNVLRRARNDAKKLIEDFFKELTESEEHHGIEYLVQNVQDLYVTIKDRFETCSAYKGTNCNERYKLLEVIEKYLTEWLNKLVFRLIATERKEDDDSLRRIIDNHHWIEPTHLEAQINLQDVAVREQLNLAISDLNEMNFKESTLDKLECIVECSRRVYTILRHCNKRRSSADDYLPILHYIVLKANPPRLRSQINFIQRFSMPHRLQTEERGYYFVSLCTVVTAIENMSSDTLNISNVEYQRLLSIDTSEQPLSAVVLCNNINNIARPVYKQQKTTKKTSCLQETFREIKDLFVKHTWPIFSKNGHPGIVMSVFPLVEATEAEKCPDGFEKLIEQAMEIDETYTISVTIDDILEDYIIIPDSAVTSIEPFPSKTTKY